jgi:hypothetical protein
VRVEVGRVTPLWFAPGDPVRAASGIAPLGTGWLVVQDDANHAAWWSPPETARIRVFPRVDGPDTFGDEDGTKHLKPDLEAACPVDVADREGVLVLGSGSLPARTRAALVTCGAHGPAVQVADLGPLHAAVALALPLAGGTLNLEGACVVGDRLRWFQRGHGATGVPSASVDLDLGAVLTVFVDGGDPAAIVPGDVHRYDLGDVDGAPLTITDAVTLPDGLLAASATAEDTPNAIDDGPVAGSAIALLDGTDVVAVAPVHASAVWKLEGLAFVDADAHGATLLAVVDQDDHRTASPAVELRLRW